MKNSDNTVKTLLPHYGYFKTLSEEEINKEITSLEESFFEWLKIIAHQEFLIDQIKKNIEKYKRLRYIEQKVDAQIELEQKEEALNRYMQRIEKIRAKMRSAYYALTEKQLSHGTN